MLYVTIQHELTAEELAWHYKELFWAGAKVNLEDELKDSTLDEAIEIFERIIEYATFGDYGRPIDLTELNDIIWYDWNNIFEENKED